MKIKAFFLLFALAGALAGASIFVDVLPCLIVKGQNCSIKWSISGAVADKVNISIWLGSTMVQQFLNVANIPGTNEKVWPVPASATTGEYTFRVATADNLVQGEYKGDIKDRGIYTNPSTPSGSLILGTPINFGWRGFGLRYSEPAIIELFRSGVYFGLIGVDAMNNSPGCGRSTTWIVGNLMDPTMEDVPLAEKAPIGSGYKIRIRNSDGSCYADSGTFAITVRIDPGWFRDRLKRLSRIPVFPGGCPMCGEVQLNDLLEIIQSEPGAHVVELWHAGRSLGKLSESKIVQGNRSMQRIDFGNSFQQLKNGGSGFELRIFDNRGKLLHTQAVVLNYKAR